MNKNVTFTLILGLFLSFILHAGVYKWTDANGKIYFSDKPHKNAAKIKIKAFKPSGVGTSENQLKRQKELLLQYQNDREQRKTKLQKINKRKTKLARQCKQLQDKILDYQGVDYLYTRKKNGKKKHLSHQRKKKETDLLKKQYDEHCS